MLSAKSLSVTKCASLELDTDEKGNIDLRIKYNPNELDEQDDAP